MLNMVGGTKMGMATSRYILFTGITEDSFSGTKGRKSDPDQTRIHIIVSHVFDNSTSSSKGAIQGIIGHKEEVYG